MTPTTYGRDFAYCLKSHGGVRGFNASLWRFLLRCTLFCHSVATFLTSVSSYEGGCGFEGIKKSSKPTTMRLLPRRNIPHPTNLSSLARRLSLMPKIVMPPVRVRFLNTAKPKRSMPRACPNRLRPSMTSFSAPKSWTSITAHQ